MDLTICKLCKIELDDKNWYPSTKKDKTNICKKCCNSLSNERNKARYKRDLEYKNHKNNYNKKRRAQNRIKALMYYSNNLMKCNCCEEKHIEFLSIDHINGGGRKHRIEVKTPNICDWLVKNNFPFGFRVLCYNCNLSLGHYKYCPHQKEDN